MVRLEAATAGVLKFTLEGRAFHTLMIRSLKKVDLARVLLNDLNSLSLWPLVRVNEVK